MDDTPGAERVGDEPSSATRAGAGGDERPVLFVTGHAPAYRAGSFACLHELEQVELALFGGRSLHGGAPAPRELPVPHRHVQPRELWALARSGRYRAVVCPTGGRTAPLACWAGARRAGAPLLLWASLWAHPRSVAHAFTYLPLRRLYGSADAVVTYGPHVSAYVRARGARNVHVAVQAVDNDFWRAPASKAPPSEAPGSRGSAAAVSVSAGSGPGEPQAAPARFLFVGRPDPAKGLATLLEAWREAALEPSQATLALAGVAPGPALPAGVHALGRLQPEDLRRAYAASDVLVVPSVPTRTFLEPWGLVVNEAMNQGLAVIATDAVGAAAGGLVRDGQNGLVVPARDGGALAGALARLASDGALRARLGAAGARDVLAYSHEAWAEGFSRALFSVGVSRVRW
jgi:glycosyltransferase involved in cell wall biosynthesis